ncbi:MAG: YajQ family cyclic di-GMP-binding protein [Candidatus Hydrogenedentes bacterium]|nr:YajQ family cyclic di-GMP-binding protein [Candidatus Hydrogenedentota bacterium]
MPTFDIVNKVDLQEVDNAINNTKKVIETRYDFRGSNTELSLDKKEKRVRIVTEDTMKLQGIHEMLAANLVKRKISPKVLDYKEAEPGSRNNVKQEAQIQEGIAQDIAKKIVKLIKDQKLKVQAQIQDDQLRVTGKKIDDLQEVIKILREKDFGIPLQYVNMKS